MNTINLEPSNSIVNKIRNYKNSSSRIPCHDTEFTKKIYDTYKYVPHVNICKCLKEEAERIRENMIDTTPDYIIDLYMTSCGEYVINNDNDYLFEEFDLDYEDYEEEYSDSDTESEEGDIVKKTRRKKKK